MDDDDINGLIQRCQKLKHKFRGVFAADNFPSNFNFEGKVSAANTPQIKHFFNSKRVKI